jgi:hypothetical protein
MFDDIKPNQQSQPKADEPLAQNSPSADSGQAQGWQNSPFTPLTKEPPANIPTPANNGQQQTAPKPLSLEGEQDDADKTPSANIPATLPSEQQPAIKPKPFATKKKPADIKEPEDIFAEIEKETPKEDYSNQPPGINMPPKLDSKDASDASLPGFDVGKSNKGKMIIIGVAVFLVAIAVAWAVYNFAVIPRLGGDIDGDNINNNEAASLPTADINNGNINKNTNAVVTNQNINIPIKPVDTDGDGLSDEDEATLGTNPNLLDTDGDGLTDQAEAIRYKTDPKLEDTDGDGLNDQQEVITYKTDPRNTDSDGDGYSDGQEVSNGYNPMGEGKLLDKVELP